MMLDKGRTWSVLWLALLKNIHIHGLDGAELPYDEVDEVETLVDREYMGSEYDDAGEADASDIETSLSPAVKEGKGTSLSCLGCCWWCQTPY